MTGFELAVLLAGLAALAVFAWAVQYLANIWTAAGQRLETRLEKILGELVRVSTELRAIQESFQKMDNT